jgi:hypothetical protein
MNMIETRRDWLQIATEIRSFRQMYRLAGEIADSAVATGVERRAAQRVVGTLRDVIDAPIADAATLAKARKRFGRLLTSLQMAA